MTSGRVLRIVVLTAILVSGCSQLPGLRVLSGQDPNTASSGDLTVQALDLVMADKSGSTDPGISAAANRIEAADNMVDIIEVRKDDETRVFTVNMLFNPPQVDTSTMEGQIAQLDALRRAFEVTWQGMMPESDGTDRIEVNLLYPTSISTLDHGTSYIGYLIAQASIDRSEAAAYLAGARNLNNFYDMVISGALQYQTPNDFIPYQGTPNHPMFMLPSSSAAAAS
jgi:hypothetical protein